MSRRRFAGLALLLLALGGCTTLPLRPLSLQVTVTPATVHPGDIVSVQVEAPDGTKSVQGRLDIAGSPVIPMHGQDNGQHWVFRTQIPVDAVWQPGRYRVDVRGEGPDGAALQGEAWILAP